MALRHPVPKFDMAAVAKEQGTPVPRFPEPPSVTFRPGTDKNTVVEQMLQQRCTQVLAAVGAGKSVKLPTLLVQATDGLVVHCVPSRLLAWSLYDYVSTQTGVHTMFSDSVTEALPEKGLVFMSNANLALRVMAWRSGLAEPPVKLALFMDESHESDFASGVLREVARTQDYIQLLAFSTATAGPVEARKREAAGTVNEFRYPYQPVANWDLDDMQKPWAPATFTGNVLVFVDKESEARDLMTKYAEYDLDVHRLSAKMSLESFQSAWAAMKDPLRGMHVTVADYAFRSGFTMLGFDRLIETGKVMYHLFDGEQTLRAERNAYRFEVYQGTARLGRTPGSVCSVYVPDIPFENVICDLEQAEIDAAALLFRMLGYKPPRRFVEASPFAVGKVPKDLYAALNSPLSMRSLAPQDLCEWSELTGKQPEVIRQPKKIGSPVFVVPKRPVSPCGTSATDAARERVLAKERVQRDVYTWTPGPDIHRVEYSEESTEPLAEMAATPYTLKGELNRLNTGLGVSMPSASRSVSVRDDYDSSRVGSPEPAFSESSGVTEDIDPYGNTTSADVLHELCERVGREMEAREKNGFMEGEYVYYPGVETVLNPRRYFPEGYRSLERVLEKLGIDAAVRNWSSDQRLAATFFAVECYNDSLMQVRAIRAVVDVFTKSYASASEFVDVTVVQKWLVSLQETACTNETVLASTVRMLRVLQERGYMVLDKSVNCEREVEIGESWFRVFSDVVNVRSDFSQDVYTRAWLDKPVPPVAPAAMRELAFHEGEAARSRALIDNGTIASKPSGARTLVHVRDGRDSGLAWLRAEGPVVGKRGGGTSGMRDKVARTIKGLK